MSSEVTFLLIVILAVGAALVALSIGLSVWAHRDFRGSRRDVKEILRDGKEYRERKARIDGTDSGPQRIGAE